MSCVDPNKGVLSRVGKLTLAKQSGDDGGPGYTSTPYTQFTQPLSSQEDLVPYTIPVSLYVGQFNFRIEHVLNTVLSSLDLHDVVNLECSRVSSGAELDEFAFYPKQFYLFRLF